MGAVIEHLEVKGIQIPLIYEQNKLLPTTNIQIVFRQSGSIEDGKMPGLASLSARILNEGTRKKGSLEFAKELESNAISLSVSSGLETLSFDLSALSSEMQRGVSLLGELLRDPNLTKEALLKVKAQAHASLLRKESDFDTIASQTLQKLLFEGTPLAEPSSGTISSIQAIGLKAIKQFLSDHMTLSRAIVLVASNLSTQEVKEEIARALSILPTEVLPPQKQFETSALAREHRVQKATKQAYVYFGAPFYIVSIEQQSAKAKVASFVLGGSGFGSRIMEEVRVKRGLAYSASMRLNIGVTQCYASGHLQTKLENEQEAIALVKEVVREFVEKGITQKELDSAKQFLLGSEPLRNETANQRLSSAFSNYYKGLSLDYSKQELERIQALGLVEVNEYIMAHTEILSLSFGIVADQ